MREFLTFLATHKKWWLVPLLVLTGLLIFLALVSHHRDAPFVYTTY
jgi:hypothetical protein